ncbi:MAG: uroporphyrinogen-III C-methyltransferase [Verrucomicrobiota bacterium]
MAKKQSGICYLTGAGPGDLGLVTLRAREVIEQADVIVYDYLCNQEMLAWARKDAETIYAGKKEGTHTIDQPAINALLIKQTKSGKRVVRLKGGDPFLFGRGGEEAEALADAGLRFEVIPGVSSTIAVPAYAGIPITHREHSSQLTIFTGHESPDKPESAIDYAKLVSQPGTKVMVMGVKRLEQIAGAMLKAGGDPAMPVALIRWGTTGQQRTVTGPLSEIAGIVRDSGFTAPALAIFGEVVNLRKKLNWFESKPLFGKRIVVTRSREQAGALSSQLRASGADVYEMPTIKILPPGDLMEFGELVRDAHTYDWVVFTSPNGVSAFFEMFFKIYQDTREIGGVRIAAIGPATAARVRDFHLFVDLQPEQSIAEGVIKAFSKECSVENLKMLIVHAEKARDVLPTELMKMGAIVDTAIAYRTVPETSAMGIERFREEGADLITFTSSSTVENFVALNLPVPDTLRTASIGPATSKTMKELGLRVDIEARQHDLDGLGSAIRNYYAQTSE